MKIPEQKEERRNTFKRNKDLRRGNNRATSLLVSVFKHRPLMAAII